MHARRTFRRASARGLARTLATLVGVATLAVASRAAAQPFSYSSLTVFGDSFSDTGNGDILAPFFGALDQTPTPPFFPGRASNGLVWVDYLAAALGRPLGAVPSLAGGSNYAIGTARTGFTGTLGLPLGIRSQVALFGGVSPIPGIPAAPHAGDPTGLYVLFGGSNDVFDAALLGSAAQQAIALNAAVDNLAIAATQLYGAGARTFLVPNVPNVGLAPLAAGTPLSPLLGALSAQFNTLLGARLAALGAGLPGSTFYGLRLDTLFENILLDVAQGGARYGLTNATVPCLPGYGPPGAPSCAVSLFADGEHPTTAVHALIADAAYARVVNGVDVAAVPEPATVVLLGGGLCVLAAGAARRRRAA